MRCLLFVALSLVILAFAAPAAAQDPSDVTARLASDSVLAPPVEADGSLKGSGAPLAWGVFSIGTGSTPYSLPFRLQLQSVDGVTSGTTSLRTLSRVWGTTAPGVSRWGRVWSGG
jgi:hypothetical protein